MKNLYGIFVKLDAPTAWGVYFQDSASPQMEGLIELHDNIMYYLVLILFSVGWILFSIIRNFADKKAPISHKYLNHGKEVPIQKCSNNNLYLSHSNFIRTYSTSRNNPYNNIYPVKIYENAFYNRKDIIKENKNKSGIYMLTNKLTDDIYIEQGEVSIPLVSRETKFKDYYSNINVKNFYEWLSGLVDGEGSFIISHRKPFSFVFSFEICLHLDDKDMLHFIQKKLGLGKVYISGNTSKLIIVKQQEIGLIIEIFNNYPLQSSKYLNFLDFKKAFELYKTKTQQPEIRDEIFKKVFEIKKGINTKRLDFTRSGEALPSKEIIITPYWLLGFVEGEGSFFISTKYNYRLIFSLTQSIKDLALMREIKNFLYKSFCEDKRELDYISLVTSKGRDNSKGAVQINISREDIINNKLIPFFNSMAWHSKKAKDYLDWIIILKLKQLGLQYTQKGLKVINLILNQMNNKRLSNSKFIKADREYLNGLIDELLKEPSNLVKIEKGKIYIKSLNRYLNTQARDKISVEIKDKNGLVANMFNSISSCAKFYGLSRSSLHRKLHKSNNVEILFENKPYIISFINSDDDLNTLENISEEVDISDKALEKPFNNPKDITKENDSKINLKPAVYIYEKCTNEGFKLIGGFTSSKKAANFLGVSTNTIIKYKNSGIIYKVRYKFTS